MRPTPLFCALTLALGLAAPSAAGAAAAAAAAAPKSTAQRDAAEALLDDASLSIKHGQYDVAIASLHRCMQTDRSLGACPRALGIAYGKVGDEHKAAYYYRLYLKASPTAPDATRVRQLISAYESD